MTSEERAIIDIAAERFGRELTESGLLTARL